MKRLDITVIHDPGQKDSKGTEKPDVVVEQVADALAVRGHKVSTFAVPADAKGFVTGILDLRPDLIFNLAETFGDNMQMEVHIGALLEMLSIPFTGADLGGLFMAQDKVLTKKLLCFHDVKYPEFCTFAPDRIETGGNIRFPLFVKPVRADSSIGIGSASLVQDYKSLIERVNYVHDTFGGAALAEEYIDGSEYYVSVLGHLTPRALPVVEMDFSGLPPNAVPVASYEAKWNSRTRAYKGTKSLVAKNLSPELAARLQDAAREAYLALQLRDYGRVDMRVSRGGDIYVIEVNPNPYLARNAELAMAAENDGISYEDLIQMIVEWAWKRRRERKSGVVTNAPAASRPAPDREKHDKHEKHATEKAHRNGDHEKPEKPEKAEKPEATEPVVEK